MIQNRWKLLLLAAIIISFCGSSRYYGVKGLPKASTGFGSDRETKKEKLKSFYENFSFNSFEDSYFSLSECVTGLVESDQPKKMTVSFLLGLSSGFLVSQLSKIIALFVGGVYVTLQTLSYYEYISINTNKVKEDLENIVGDPTDIQGIMNKVKDVLSKNIPSSSSFAYGFWRGVRAH